MANWKLGLGSRISEYVLQVVFSANSLMSKLCLDNV